jgi:transposase-like protein
MSKSKRESRSVRRHKRGGAAVPVTAKEALDEHPEGNQCEIRSSKYLNNRIEQDHRSIKLRLAPMLGLKNFRQAATTIAGIELMHRIRKSQFKLGKLHIRNKTAPEIWNAVLAA